MGNGKSICSRRKNHSSHCHVSLREGNKRICCHVFVFAGLKIMGVFHPFFFVMLKENIHRKACKTLLCRSQLVSPEKKKSKNHGISRHCWFGDPNKNLQKKQSQKSPPQKGPITGFLGCWKLCGLNSSTHHFLGQAVFGVFQAWNFQMLTSQFQGGNGGLYGFVLIYWKWCFRITKKQTSKEWSYI